MFNKNQNTGWVKVENFGTFSVNLPWIYCKLCKRHTEYVECYVICHVGNNFVILVLSVVHFSATYIESCIRCHRVDNVTSVLSILSKKSYRSLLLTDTLVILLFMTKLSQSLAFKITRLWKVSSLDWKSRL